MAVIGANRFIHLLGQRIDKSGEPRLQRSVELSYRGISHRGGLRLCRGCLPRSVQPLKEPMTQPCLQAVPPLLLLRFLFATNTNN